MKIYKFYTLVEGWPIYTKNPDAKHPFMSGECPQEIKCTKKNLMDYILWTQEDEIYTQSELRKLSVPKLMKIVG